MHSEQLVRRAVKTKTGCTKSPSSTRVLLEVGVLRENSMRVVNDYISTD